ncbi:hypothetical protein TCAL_15944 [Tigriopus californicus]|uniref:Reverse transcriptase domain-containing protein n=1 Tax=Tigriopus californicus TaxID=6832 RepID=A0A553PFG5_TIGCA|nr:hypothetical protein TCAL_15944 [Tigriopus californicus]
MTGVVFGDSSSPCQAIHVLWRTAEEFGSPELLDLVRTRFYMDDYLNSHRTKEDAIQTNRLVSETLKHGKFHLTKWTSNAREVQEEMSGETQDKVELTGYGGGVLGMHWDPSITAEKK